MIAYEFRFLDASGNLTGASQSIDGLGVESAYERALEALMTEPGYIGFELLQDNHSVRRFVRRPREIE